MVSSDGKSINKSGDRSCNHYPAHGTQWRFAMYINAELMIIAILNKKCGNFGLDTPEGKIKNAQLVQIPSLR